MANDTSAATFALAPRADVAELRARFAGHGRVEIPFLLADGQDERLRAHLLARTDWRLVLNAGDKVYEIARADYAAMADQERRRLTRMVEDAGRHGFQYCYEAIRVGDSPDERDAAASPLTAFVDFLGSPAVVSLLTEITGLPDIGFVDGQATAYAPGHFLTRHDDDVAGKGRLAAYVFGLAPRWRAEWGGLLMFHGDDGNIGEAFVPAMGALRLFAVPTPHSVSYVTPLAPEPRLSVTGWLRRGG